MGIFIFILGLAFGSFANVCIYRLPKSKSILSPGSYCPECKKPIKWYDNIPLISYFILKGKCRNCKSPISPRYPVVEFLTGMLFYLVYRKFGFNFSLLIYLILILSLVIISGIDLDTFLIPDVIVIPGIILGLFFSFLYPQMFGMERVGSFLYSLTGAIAGAVILLFLGFVGKIMAKKEAMGGGDVKLLAMVGAFVGWKSVLITLFFASLIGTLITLILVLIGVKKIQDYVPFGPYLSLGAMVSIFWKGYTFLGFYIP